MDNVSSYNYNLELVRFYVENTDRNIFLTGKAGTGKTTFLRDLAATTFKRMVILAPTGVAAINAGGMTIHSFFRCLLVHKYLMMSELLTVRML